MNIRSILRLATRKPMHRAGESCEQAAVARYDEAKAKYEACQSKGDKRGMGEAFRAMQPALHEVLAHSDASRLHTHRARFSARSRPARA